MAKPKPRIVYIHGDGVLYWSWGWVPGVQRDLQAASFPTFFELFPDSIEARAKYWLPFLRDHVRVSADDVLLGWSCGSVAAMRVAQEARVRGLVLLAPYFNDYGYEVVRNAGWIDAPWDWAQIRRNADSIAMFHSDADPYIPQAEFAELATHLSARVFEIKGAGHFGEQAHFPELTDYIVRTYG